MSPLTILLAKLLGLYCIILTLAMMTRRQSAIAAVWLMAIQGAGLRALSPDTTIKVFNTLR